MIDMQGQIAVVFGVANKRSIAYSIAESLAGAGATLVLCYQTDRLKKDSDVSSDEEIDAAFFFI